MGLTASSNKHVCNYPLHNRQETEIMHLTLAHVVVTFMSLVLGCNGIHKVLVENNCPSEIWIGILGNHGKSQPEQGGFKLQPHRSHKVFFPYAWGGRMWARTGCGSGPCETGDCGGGKLHCNGAGGIPPVTLMEVTFDGHAGLDFYDISLVDGFNLPVAMWPIYGTYQSRREGKYYCQTAACKTNINKICPASQMKVYGRSGRVVACRSACLAFNTDRFCCRNQYGTADKCPPFSYSEIFKRACPDAYSYAYDDYKSTFTCKGSWGKSTDYKVKFC